MAHWRDEINPEIKQHFERLVTKSAQHKETYEKANHGAIAQLWTANAIQEKELDELRAKITVLENAIKVLADKGKLAEQAIMKAAFVEKALIDITGKKPEEALENRRLSAPRDEFSKEKIDANKAMREVISRTFVKKKDAKSEIEDDDSEDDEEPEDDDGEPEEEKKPARVVSCSCPDDENILCRHPGIAKEKGYLYYISKEGNLARVPMARGNSENEKFKQEILHQCNIQREYGWLYYVDRNMNAARAPMERKGEKAVSKKKTGKKA